MVTILGGYTVSRCAGFKLNGGPGEGCGCDERSPGDSPDLVGSFEFYCSNQIQNIY